MEYRRIYDAFVADRLGKFPSKAKHTHRERHHIIPKCLDGSDDDANIVSLTYSDHIFAHLLLAKIHGGKLAIAFQKMTTIERYKGRHTRLEHAALMAEARRAKGEGRKGEKGRHTPAQAAGLRRYNESRRGKPPSPAQAAHIRRVTTSNIGKPAHPNSIAAAARSGLDRTPAQIERNRLIAERRRGKPATPEMLAGSQKAAAKLRGKSWPAARRAAYEASKMAGAQL